MTLWRCRICGVELEDMEEAHRHLQNSHMDEVQELEMHERRDEYLEQVEEGSDWLEPLPEEVWEAMKGEQEAGTGRGGGAPLPLDVRPHDILVYSDTLGLQHRLPVIAVHADEGVTVRRSDGTQATLPWSRLTGENVRVVPAEGRVGEGQPERDQEGDSDD